MDRGASPSALLGLALSVALYVCCLPFYSFCVNGRCSDWPSWGVLVFGWLGIAASPANFLWAANPLLLLGWLCIAAGDKRIALYLSVSSLILSVAFLGMNKVVTSEGGTPYPITGVKLGYWFWLASTGVSAIASMMMPRRQSA